MEGSFLLLVWSLNRKIFFIYMILLLMRHLASVLYNNKYTIILIYLE